MMKSKCRAKVVFLLFICFLCLWMPFLRLRFALVRDIIGSFLTLRWMGLECLITWCIFLILISSIRLNVFLISLLAIVCIRYIMAVDLNTHPIGPMILLSSLIIAKLSFFILRVYPVREVGSMADINSNREALDLDVTFLGGFVILLAFSSCWQVKLSHGIYSMPRWIGLWGNPNTYGMLMGAGTMLAIGLLAQIPSLSGNSRFITLLISVLVMGVGLILSYSRGAWLGVLVGLLYFANAFRKVKWRYVVPGIIAFFGVIWCFWKATPDSAPWYIKRMDFSRPSAQHRVAAWKAGFEIMRDHPFGVGWDRTVELYQQNYSPPEDGALAITTNDYLMLGTQLGIPALLCFLIYVAFCFQKLEIQGSELRIKTACRAAALSILVAFWFDGGLFRLPTAVVFWILLELGACDSRTKNIRPSST